MKPEKTYFHTSLGKVFRFPMESDDRSETLFVRHAAFDTHGKYWKYSDVRVADLCEMEATA